MILELVVITAAITYIVNHSGITISVSKAVFKYLNPGKFWNGELIMKPFSCAICLSFWTVLIMSLFGGISIVYSLGLASAFSLLSILADKLIAVSIKLIHLIK